MYIMLTPQAELLEVKTSLEVLSTISPGLGNLSRVRTFQETEATRLHYYYNVSDCV
jgi:hypothetical protein